MSKHIIDYLRHTSIWAMLLIFAGLAADLAPDMAEQPLLLALAAGGALLFFTTEYTTHRFVFHMPPPKRPFALKMLKALHYDHHEDPNDLHHLFLPIWYGLSNFGILFLIVWGITDSIVYAEAVAAGGILALLYYEWVHFVAHRPIKPWTAYGRWMKKYHLWHHYKSERFWFGVTNPVLDMVFGTRRNEKQVEMSQTARKLHGNEPM